MQVIRVAVVDDQTLIRDGIAALLALMPDLSVVGKAAEGNEAIRLAETQAPDVILIDVRMPGMNGISATREICARCPATRVIVLTTFDDDEYVFEALRAGASGYLLKNADPDYLAQAIRAVHAGQSILDPAVTHKVVQYFAHLPDSVLPQRVAAEHLTDREREILTGIAQGQSNAEIAGQLSLSEGTVKNHVSHILSKLNARDRAHAVRLAVEWGLLRE